MGISTINAPTSITTDTGALTTDQVTNDSTLTFTGTYQANNGGGGAGTLFLLAQINGSSTWTLLGQVAATVGNPVTYTITTSTLTTNGTYKFAIANNSTAPGAISSTVANIWTFDNVAPTVDTVIVAGNEIVNTGEESPLTLSGHVTGANGGTVTIAIFNGATQIGSVTTAVDGSGNYSTSISALTLPDAGVYTAKATAMDIAGNNSALFNQSFDSQVCFLAGTMIRTADGEKAIETLVPGDLIVTADGSAKPVKFIGKQTVSLIFADKLKSQPIIIKAGALSENSPSRDLYTSPGHSMLLDGNLVIAGAMVNGRSIVRWEQCPGVFAYYHVELEEHAVIFAEGAATETYCDNVPRDVFDNGREYKALYPNAQPIKQLDMPTVKSQRQMPAAIKRHLAERAAAIGAKLVEKVA